MAHLKRAKQRNRKPAKAKQKPAPTDDKQLNGAIR